MSQQSRPRRAAASHADEQMRVIKGRTLASLTHIRPEPAPSSSVAVDRRVNFLVTLPEELQLAIVSLLVERDICALACSCTAARGLVYRNATELWRGRLAHAGIKVDDSLLASPYAAQINFRELQRCLGTPGGGRRELEVQGLSTNVDNAGERRAWWRCEAVGVAVRVVDSVTAQMVLMVRVHTRGYPESDDEWRPFEALRPQSEVAVAAWRRQKRHVDELCEVSWAPRGHPAARWEAVVLNLFVLKDTQNKVLYPAVGVRYESFADAWDEGIKEDSRRLYPRRSDDRFVQHRAWLATNNRPGMPPGLFHGCNTGRF